ncbi:protein of unknown function [Trichlorobacter ammonificans]|uniref:Uncharacterized protein n=1 Tax=Trichlorobacter ammonificans TaxID=2916410 RepID=A0ABM9D675_9BACT|nr:protein of unknown function [Trichlorobacter ammonificans]
MGRALLAKWVKEGGALPFQSTPALWDGRFHQACVTHWGFTDVSIHARPLGRALPACCWLFRSTFQFQSTPALWDGRFTSPGVMPAMSCCFNPRPPFGTGASNQQRPRERQIVSFNPRPPFGTGASHAYFNKPYSYTVSIHARPLGRALRVQVFVQVIGQQFQSTPALWDGRFSVLNDGLERKEMVSIHARPLGRALRENQGGRYSGKQVSIHARPLGRALRQHSYPAPQCSTGFNPRPPFGTGASEEVWQ